MKHETVQICSSPENRYGKKQRLSCCFRIDRMRFIAVLPLAAIILWVSGCSESPFSSRTFEAYGVSGLIKIDPGALEHKKCNELMDQAVKVFDQRLELAGAPDGELAMLNNQRGPVKISPQLKDLLTFAEDMRTATESAWDSRFGAVAELWGLDSSSPSVPDGEVLYNAVQQAVSTKIVFFENNEVSLEGDGKIDLRRLATGWAIDGAAQVLIDGSIPAGMVTADEVYRLWGKSELEELGRIEVKLPEFDSTQYNIEPAAGGVCTITLSHINVSQNEKVYHNLLDTQTGFPMDELIGVSVWSKTAAEASILAEAMFILGHSGAVTWRDLRHTGGFEAGLFIISPDDLGYTAEGDEVMSQWVNVYVP